MQDQQLRLELGSQRKYMMKMNAGLFGRANQIWKATTREVVTWGYVVGGRVGADQLK